ncbi:MAG: hypothetical protein Q9162_000422 [Coniocarpon cinnabarinum]
MSKHSADQAQKRKRGAPKPALSNKRIKQAGAYHSSSSEDEAEPIQNVTALKKAQRAAKGRNVDEKSEEQHLQLPNLAAELQAPNGIIKSAPHEKKSKNDGHPQEDEASLGSEVEEDSEEEHSSSEDETSVTGSTQPGRKKSKRHDPEVFANSIQRILSSKLTSSKRSDPMLSRSAAAQDAAKTLTEQKLDTAARRKMRADKKAEKEKGRDKDVLGLNREDVSTVEVVELEKMLKRTAQKGVVKLFNAVRAAQMGGLEAEREAQSETRHVVGLDSRKKKADEKSKEGFLDMLSNGKQAAA